MKRILDPSFRYRASFNTDLRKTFARARRNLRESQALATRADGNVTVLRGLPTPGKAARGK